MVFQGSVDSEPHCTFDLDIKSPQVKTHLSFYGHTDEFAEFGRELVKFPERISHTVSFELGNANRAYAMEYLLISAYCVDPQGHTALRIIIDNGASGADYHRFEFSIPSEAASINKLGALLASWNVSNTPEITWKSETR